MFSVPDADICHPDINPCLNDANCIAGYNNETDLQFRCECLEGYSGEICKSKKQS